MYKRIKYELGLNPISLIFKEKEKEKEYTYYRYLSKTNIVKSFLIGFAIVFTLIAVFDLVLLKNNPIFFNIFKFLISLIAIILFVKYPKIDFRNQHKYVLFFIYFVFVSIIIQALFFPGITDVNLYMIGFSIIVYSTLFLIGIKFKESVISVMVAQIIFYSLLILKYPHEVSFIPYFLLVQANIVFIFSAYQLELYNREAFVYINKLEEENEKNRNLFEKYKEKDQKYKQTTEKHINDEQITKQNEDYKPINTNRIKSILVVDDEADNLLYIESVAIKMRLNLYKAKNGIDAVNLFKKNKNEISLVLMDIRMPEMNGYEAATEIKRLKPNVPVILITAHTDQIKEDVGVDLIMIKPVSSVNLKEIISTYLK